jgi:hypothetical protein
MPRQRRLMGPRKKVDIASLRSMPREERLRLLIESVAECGGKPESLNGDTFRRLLGEAQTTGRQTS